MLKILLPVDGSEASLDAVKHALNLKSNGLSVTFVLANVQTPATLYEMVTARDIDVLDQVSQAASADALAAAEALLAGAGVSWEREVGNGDPAHVLGEIIERHGVDAVVMGTRGQGAAGSVSQWLLQHGPVPVTVVRHMEVDPEVDADTDLAD